MIVIRASTNKDMDIARLSHDHSGHDKQLKHTCDLVFSNMDLLTLILVTLPSRELMQFKCVSKSWLSLITSPHFSFFRSMRPFPPPSGLFVQGRCRITFSSDPVFYFPLRNEYNDSGMIRKLPVFCNYLFGGCGGSFACHCRGSRLIRILDSSHGLLLCSDCTLGAVDKLGRDHYIYNPTTNQLVTLPRPTDQSFVCSFSMTLAFCPSNSPHYKVIACATMPQRKSRQFEIYSSETKSWRVSGQPFIQPDDGIRFTNGVYCNGSVYYWICKLKSEANSADFLFFNLNEERLEKLPPLDLTPSLKGSSYFGKSEDHLHFIKVSYYATSFHVYELKFDHSGWFIKYQVDLAQLSIAYPHKKINDLHDRSYYRVDVLSLVRRDKFVEDDSFLVLDIPGKVIRYNLVNRNFEEIFDHKEVINQDKQHKSTGCGGLNVWQYIECHSSV